MASSYTEHFQLNQWAAEDPVLREDFNADNAKLDKVIPRIVTGTYTGDGTADRTNLSGVPSQGGAFISRRWNDLLLLLSTKLFYLSGRLDLRRIPSAVKK